MAGGLAPTAKSQIFLFHRTSDQWFEVKKVNLKDLMHGKNVNEDAILKPGRYDFCSRDIHYEFPQICALLTQCRDVSDAMAHFDE